MQSATRSWLIWASLRVGILKQIYDCEQLGMSLVLEWLMGWYICSLEVHFLIVFFLSSSISNCKNHRVLFHQEQPTTHRKHGIYYFSHLEWKHLWYGQRLNWRGSPRRRSRTPSLRHLHLERCDTTFRRHFDARRPTSPKCLSYLLCCFEQRP